MKEGRLMKVQLASGRSYCTEMQLMLDYIAAGKTRVGAGSVIYREHA